MHIIINGTQKEIEASMTLSRLLASLRVDKKEVAVERNFHVVQKKNFDSLELAEGDALEIVRFVGGG